MGFKKIKDWFKENIPYTEINFPNGSELNFTADTWLSPDNGVLNTEKTNLFSYVNGEVVYSGTETILVDVSCDTSIEADGPDDNATISLAITKDSTPPTTDPDPIITRKIANNDEGAVGVSNMLELSTGDVLNLWLKYTKTADVNLNEAIFCVKFVNFK